MPLKKILEVNLSTNLISVNLQAFICKYFLIKVRKSDAITVSFPIALPKNSLLSKK